MLFKIKKLKETLKIMKDVDISLNKLAFRDKLETFASNQSGIIAKIIFTFQQQKLLETTFKALGVG